MTRAILSGRPYVDAARVTATVARTARVVVVVLVVVIVTIDPRRTNARETSIVVVVVVVVVVERRHPSGALSLFVRGRVCAVLWID